MAQLTNEEKIIKKYFEKLVSKNRITGISKNELMSLCNEYVKEVVRKTKFEKEVINIEDEKDPDNAGSMKTEKNGTPSTLNINFDMLLSKNGFKSKDKFIKFRAFVEILDTLNHETQHYFQNKEVENYRITQGGMKFANCMEIIRERIATMAERDKFYGNEEGNYKDLYIEGDARRAGAVKTSTQLFRIFPKMSAIDKGYLVQRVVKSIEKDNVEFNDLKYDSSYEKYDRGDVTSAYVDELVAAKPNILKEKGFEMLGFEYDTDGSRLSFEEVLEYRDAVVDSIKNNGQIKKRETRQDILRQTNSGFSQIMYNALRRASPEKIIDIRRRIGDEKFIEELEYIHDGKLNEIKERVEKYKQYVQFFEKNKERINKKLYNEAYEKLDKLCDKTGYVIKKDQVTNEEFVTSTSKPIKFITKIGQDVLDTRNMYPLYTEKELEESNQKRKVAKAEYVTEMKDAFAQRRFEQMKKHEREKRIKQEEERARREKEKRAQMRKMKNPLYRLGYNISRIVKNSQTKKLNPAGNNGYHKEALYEKRDELKELNDKKDLLQNEYINIKSESEEVLLKAENQIYLEKQEERESNIDNIKEEKNIGKGDI
jgi:hypothetical protein